MVFAIFWQIFGGHHFLLIYPKVLADVLVKTTSMIGTSSLGMSSGEIFSMKTSMLQTRFQDMEMSDLSWSSFQKILVLGVICGQGQGPTKKHVLHTMILLNRKSQDFAKILLLQLIIYAFWQFFRTSPKTIVVQWFMSWFGWNRSILQGPSMKFGRSALSQCQYVGLAASVEVKHFTAMYCTSHSFLGICTYFMMNVTWTWNCNQINISCQTFYSEHLRDKFNPAAVDSCDHVVFGHAPCFWYSPKTGLSIDKTCSVPKPCLPAFRTFHYSDVIHLAHSTVILCTLALTIHGLRGDEGPHGL